MPGGGGDPAAQTLAIQMKDFHPGRSPKPGAHDRHLAGADSGGISSRPAPASPRPALPCSGTCGTSKPPATAGARPTPSGARGRRGTCCRPPRYSPGVRGRCRTLCGPPRYPASPRDTPPAWLRLLLPLPPPSPALRAPRSLLRPPRPPRFSYPSSAVPDRPEWPAHQAPPPVWLPPPCPPPGPRV
jgi:hypothetical protein